MKVLNFALCNYGRVLNEKHPHEVFAVQFLWPVGTFVPGRVTRVRAGIKLFCESCRAGALASSEFQVCELCKWLAVPDEVKGKG